MAPKSNVAAQPKTNRSQAIRDYLAAHPNAVPTEIQTALKAKGINVSIGLIGMVKYTKKGKGGSAKPTGRRPGRPPGSTTKVTRIATAVKSGGRGSNKSDAVREYLAANPAASPIQVQQALKARGIAISASLASAIKYAKRGPGRPKGSGRGRRAATVSRPVGRPPASRSNGWFSAEDLMAAKAFVDRIGGAAAARKALDLLAQLS
jgi:hypothetical protein